MARLLQCLIPVVASLRVAMDKPKAELPAMADEQPPKGLDNENPAEGSLPKPCRKGATEDCGDPWIQTKVCEKPYEVPNYRLGDLFAEPRKSKHLGLPADPIAMGQIFKNKGHVLAYFPKSIGFQYLKTKRKPWDWDSLSKVLDSEEYKDFERPAKDTLVIHLRGYDALFERGKGWYQQDNYYYNVTAGWAAKDGFKKAIIVTGDHRVTQLAKNHDPNTKVDWEAKLKQTTEATTKRIHEIQQIFESHGFAVSSRVNYNADCDFIFMVNAPAFVPSGGEYDKLVEDMVKRRRGKVFGYNVARRHTEHLKAPPANETQSS